MRNYECLRGGHSPRDIYSELRRIEERGQRLKESRKPILASFFGTSNRDVRDDGSINSV